MESGEGNQELKSELDKEIESKICSFGVNEFLSFSLDDLKTMTPKDQEQKHNDFITRFRNVTTAFHPNYSYKEVERSFEKTPKIADLSDLYQRQYETADKIRQLVIERLNDREKYANNAFMMSRFLESMSKHMTFCQNAITTIEANQELPYSLYEAAIKLEIIEQHRSFALKSWLNLFKRIDLIKRKEIVSFAFDRFTKDEESWKSSIPLVNNSPLMILSELERLSNVLGIHFDLSQHDGQHFSYLCENSYSTAVKTPLVFLDSPIDYSEFEISKDDTTLMGANSQVIAPKNSLVLDAIQNLSECDSKYSDELFRMMNTREIPRERVGDLIKLRYVRNKQLFIEINEMISEICAIGQKSDSFKSNYMLFIREQVTSMLAYAVNAISNGVVDHEMLLEATLDLESRYISAKLQIVKVLLEVQRHTDTQSVGSLIDKIVLMQPFVANKPCFRAFVVQIQTMEMMANTMELLVNLQIVAERQSKAVFWEHYPIFLSGGCGELFEVFPHVGRVAELITISEKVFERMRNSLSTKDGLFGFYIKYAIWHVFDSELKKQPETICGMDGFESLDGDSHVQGLKCCRYLDDVNCVIDVINKAEDSERTIIAKNLRQFISLGWKLRRYIWTQSQMFDAYEQCKLEFAELCESPDKLSLGCDFADENHIMEVCRSGNFDELVKAVNTHRIFVNALETALSYNNYRRDHVLMRTLFGVKDEDANLFITKSKHSQDGRDGGQNLLFHATSMFCYFERFYESDYSSVFCKLPTDMDYSDIEKVKNYFIPFAKLTELAVICAYERHKLGQYSAVGTFQIGNELMSNDGEFFPFSVPYPAHCLHIKTEDKKINHLLDFAAARCHAIHQVHFERSILTMKSKWFEAMQREELLWDAPYLARMKGTIEKLSIEESTRLLQKMIMNQINRIKMAILIMLDEILTAAKNVTLAMTESDAKKCWTALNDTSRIDFIGRYVPKTILTYPTFVRDSVKTKVADQLEVLSRRVETGFVHSPNEDVLQKSYAFLNTLLCHSVLKYAYFMLCEKCDYNELDVTTAVTRLTPKIRRDSNSEYTNKVALPATQKLGSAAKKGAVESMFLTEESALLQIVITGLLYDLQETEMQDHKNSLSNSIMTAFQVSGSCMKPEFYSKKTGNTGVSKKSNFVPSPTDASKQFGQETRYVQTKIISNLLDVVHAISRRFGDDQDVTIDAEVLAEKLKPLSELMSNFFDVCPPQLLKTWESYTANLRVNKASVDCENAKLDMLVKHMLKNYNCLLEHDEARMMPDKFLQLSSLRRKESDIKHEQVIFEKETTRMIRHEYAELLKDLELAQKSVRQEYPVFWAAYFNAGLKSIHSEFTGLEACLESIQPNMQIAKKSLAVSRELDIEYKKWKRSLEEEEDGNEEEAAEATPPSQSPESAPEDSEMIPRPSILTPTHRFRGNYDDESSENILLPREPSSAMNLLNPRHSVRSMTSDDSTESISCSDSRPQSSRQSRRKRCGSTASSRRMMRISSQGSLIVRRMLDQYNKDNEGRLNFQMIQKKIEKTKQDNEALRKEILKERLVRCIMRIGTTRHYTRAIMKVGDEKKMASGRLWRGQRHFEEEIQELDTYLKEGYRDLAKAESEIERLRSEIEDGRKVTAKLSHWKEINLRSADGITKELEKFSNTGNINVDNLLLQLQEKQMELDELIRDQEIFDIQVEMEVREPMKQCESAHRALQKAAVESIMARKKAEITPLPQDVMDRNKAAIAEFSSLNKRLDVENRMLRDKIQSLEEKLKKYDQTKLENVMPLFETKQRLPHVTCSYYFPKKVTKPELTPRGPFSKYKYRSPRPMFL